MLHSVVTVRRSATVLVCAFAMALLTPVVASVHADGLCLSGCRDDGFGPMHARVAFEGVRPPVDADHCQLCHWLRDVSRAVPRPAVSATVPFEQAAVILRPDARAARPYAVDDQQSRAPPRSRR